MADGVDRRRPFPYNVPVPEEVPCVTCHRRPAVAAWRPFCSERCRLLDLGRWLNGSYRIPGEPVRRDEPEPDPHDLD